MSSRKNLVFLILFTVNFVVDPSMASSTPPPWNSNLSLPKTSPSSVTPTCGVAGLTLESNLLASSSGNFMYTTPVRFSSNRTISSASFSTRFTLSITFFIVPENTNLGFSASTEETHLIKHCKFKSYGIEHFNPLNVTDNRVVVIRIKQYQYPTLIGLGLGVLAFFLGYISVKRWQGGIFGFFEQQLGKPVSTPSDDDMNVKPYSECEVSQHDIDDVAVLSEEVEVAAPVSKHPIPKPSLTRRVTKRLDLDLDSSKSMREVSLHELQAFFSFFVAIFLMSCALQVAQVEVDDDVAADDDDVAAVEDDDDHEATTVAQVEVDDDVAAVQDDDDDVAAVEDDDMAAVVATTDVASFINSIDVEAADMAPEIPENVASYRIPHKKFTGNRPSLCILIPSLDGYTFGQDVWSTSEDTSSDIEMEISPGGRDDDDDMASKDAWLTSQQDMEIQSNDVEIKNDKSFQAETHHKFMDQVIRRWRPSEYEANWQNIMSLFRESCYAPMAHQQAQKAPSVVFHGRRDIKVKALEAAMTAKCREEKMEKERKKKKEAFKIAIERAKKQEARLQELYEKEMKKKEHVQVQQKQAAGKRDIRLNALQAAMAAKCREEENEKARKKKKEEFKIQIERAKKEEKRLQELYENKMKEEMEKKQRERNKAKKTMPKKKITYEKWR